MLRCLYPRARLCMFEFECGGGRGRRGEGEPGRGSGKRISLFQRLLEVEGTRLLRLLYPHKGAPHKRILSACLPFRRLSRPSRALAPRRPTAASSTSPYGCFGLLVPAAAAAVAAVTADSQAAECRCISVPCFLHGFFVSKSVSSGQSGLLPWWVGALQPYGSVRPHGWGSVHSDTCNDHRGSR